MKPALTQGKNDRRRRFSRIIFNPLFSITYSDFFSAAIFAIGQALGPK
jgi:hypothetical protein